MGPDFDPEWPGAHMLRHFQQGSPHPHFVPPLWPVVGSVLLVLVLMIGLWVAGYWFVLGRAALSGEHRERTDRRAVWDDAVARHHAVAERFARFECDAQAVLSTPGLADVRQAPTARFIDAFAEAGALATERYPAQAFARRFIEAVEREERAWAAAVAAAERSRDARFSPDERAVLEQARRLLEVVGSSSYVEERHTALRQAMRRLRDLERRTGWRLPAPAAAALEQRARGVLAGPDLAA